MHRYIIIVLTCLLSLAVVEGAAGGELSLSARLDKTDIAFEETVSLVLEVRWTGTIADYRFGILPLPETEYLAVQGSSSAISSEEQDGQDITTRIFRYEFKPTKGGIGRILPITLEYLTMPDSISGQLTTQEYSIQIAPPVVLAEPTGLAWYHYVIIAVVLAGAVFVVVLIIKKGRRPVAVETTPEQTMLEKLSEIRGEGHIDRKVFYTRLYRLLLDYIDRKYEIAIVGGMTPDVIAALDDKEIPRGEKEKLAGWLTLADREKYAPGGGEPGDTIRLITEMENYMQNCDRRG
ncbi:MAG: hypothetical protein JW763_06050 [candidate division Zixibacteria bacterium]|nr:hypothetical protein [candidate division Zixibacteria bacterium]